MYRWSLVAGVVAVAGAMGSVSRAESATDLLEKGIYTEQTVGDLDAAIKIYGQIVAKAEANRAAVAQAYFRLGECYLKKSKPTEARAAFEKLIAQFPDQTDLVAQAKKRIETECPKASRAETKKAVKEAMKTISTGVDGDPRVRKALESLKSFDEQQVAEELLGYLDSTEPTVRRSAIYVLHMGGLENIDAAVPKLQGLLSHSEDLTRGMAALALGEHKVMTCYDAISQMATKDASGYARRCAVYALGLMGAPQAKPVLEQVLKDSDPLVRGNAEAAIKMLSKENEIRTTYPTVVKTTPSAFAENVPSDLKEITVTFDRPMMDKNWSWVGGGDTYPKITGKIHYDEAKTTCTLPVELQPGKVYWVGINSPSHKNFQTPDHVPAKRYVILFATAGADGKPTPIPNDLLKRAKEINAAAREEAAAPAAGGAVPVVVSTTPPALANDVNPSTKEITVTFDRRMMDKSWSWTGGGDTYPKPAGNPRYDETRKTCTLPVELQPGKVYWVGINAPSYKNFQTPDHVPAKRYVILFATAGADGKATPIPEDLLARARQINGQAGVADSQLPGPSAGALPPTPAAKPGQSLPVSEHRKLLDEQTAADVKKLEDPAGSFGGLFHVEEEYEAASDDQKKAMLDKWLDEARSNDRDQRSRAIASLGNVASTKAVPVLVGITKESNTDNRPRWLAVRALSRIRDKSTVPLLIGLVDHKNWNVRTYAKVALCETTGVYFGDSKKKWQAWWEENKESQ